MKTDRQQDVEKKELAALEEQIRKVLFLKKEKGG